ncbi:MAG TPA: hypothetical protein VKS25_11040 [Solirubrobacteraceae bacterium]|nr:hypothetical protein [Solirubrobacteraceae bacterium]
MSSPSCTAQPGLASRRAVRRSARCAASGTLMLGNEKRVAHGRQRRINSASVALLSTTRAGYRAASGCFD